MIKKSDSLYISELIINNLAHQYSQLSDDITRNTSGLIDTFNNCRETGLMLSLYNYKMKDFESLHIWAFENRSSDHIVIIYGDTQDRKANNMFSEGAYDNKKIFSCNETQQALDYTYNLMVEYLKRTQGGN